MLRIFFDGNALIFDRSLKEASKYMKVPKTEENRGFHQFFLDNPQLDSKIRFDFLLIVAID